MIRMDGVLIDIPDAVRCFQKYTHEERANHAASHRLGYRQRGSTGQFYWTHNLVPGIAFPTRKAARLAALKAVALRGTE